MNAIPHIGRTLTQRYADLDKTAVRHRLESHVRQLKREEEAEAWKPEPCQFVAANEEFEPQSVSEGVLYACCLFIAAVMILVGVLS